MNAALVIDLLEAKPFRPFVVYVPFSEASLYVEDPKLARVEDDTLFLRERAARSTEGWDQIVDLTLVAAIQVRRSRDERE